MNKPWLDKNGDLLSDAELKIISKDWTQAQWDQYLSATIDVDQNENEVLHPAYNELLSELPEPLENETRLPDKVSVAVRNSVRTLTKKQRPIIRGVFWHDLSERDLEKVIGISRSLVSRQKTNSLNKIKRLLKRDGATSSYLIGGLKRSTLKDGNLNALQLVYQADRKGSSIK